MAKLGVQLQDQQAGSGRPTRTQRVARKQAVQRDVRAEERFEILKAKAKEIQETKFKDKVVDGKVIPFTLEDVEGTKDNSYKDIYDGLSPDLKQFFDTPDVVLEQKATRIKTTKETVAERLAYADQKIAERTAYWNKKIIDKRKWWGEQRSSWRNETNRDGERYRSDNYRDKLDQYDDKLDEDIAKWQGYKSGLSKGSSELNQNKDIDFASIDNYANEVANYEEDRREAKNENRETKRERAREVDYLLEKGYEANLIEESFKGNPESVSLGFYNPETKDWKTVAKVKSTGKIDVSNYEKLGYSDPQQRTFSYGGKDFKFKSGIGIYKNKATGMVVSPYASTGFTEQQLIKKAQDDYYENVYLPERNARGIYTSPKPDPKVTSFGGITSIPQDNIVGFVDQGSPSSETKYLQIPTEVYEAGQNRKPDVIDKAVNWMGDLYGKIPQGELVLTPIGLSFASGGEGLEKYEYSVTDLIGKGRDWLSGGSKRTAEGINELPSVKPELDAVKVAMGEENQLRYEDLVAKDLIYGNITTEEAEKKYKASDSYKELLGKYDVEYTEVRDEAIKRENIGFGSALGYGAKGFAYGTGDFLLGRVETPKKLIETSAVVTGAVVTYGAVTNALSPAVLSAVNWGVIGAGGGYGAYKMLDPNSNPMEVFGGSVMLGTSLAFAGYGAYKHLKSPYIPKRTPIKAPKMDLKTTSTIGKDTAWIKGDVTSANKVVYKAQKLSQVGMDGSRQVISTKWRHYLNSFNKKFNYKISFDKVGSGLGTKFKFDLLKPSQRTIFKPITRGLPSDLIPNKVWYGSSVRGDYKIILEKSNYAKAGDLLKKYGYSDAQVKATLRYTAPRVYEVSQKGFLEITKGGKATGIFENTIHRPVIKFGNLGLKTRGGADLKEITKVTRQLSKDVTGKIFAREQGFGVSGFVDKAGNIKDWKQFELFSGKIYAGSRDYKGFEYLGRQNNMDVWKENQKIKDIVSFSKRDPLDLKIAKTRTAYNIDIMNNPATKIHARNTQLYKKIIDLDKGKNVWQKPANIKKTPFSFTFGDKIDDVAGITKKTGSSTVNKIIAKIDKIDDFSRSGNIQQQIKQQSKYYGTGQYEQSSGYTSLSPQEILKNSDLLKTTMPTPQIKINELKYLIGAKDMKYFTGVKVASLMDVGVGIGIKSVIKNDFQLKSNLKLDSLIKTDLKIDSLIKTAQLPAIKTSPALKSQLKSVLDLDLGGLPIGTTPTFKTPKFNPPKTPVPKIPLVLWLKQKGGKKKKKGFDMGGFEKAYLPDFTSRALGLAPENVNVKKLMAKINKVQTGLEIRRGVKVKF